MFKKQYSIQIFNQLMNGKVINRQIIDNDHYINNPLFIEIMQNLEQYQLQYTMSGFKFIHHQDYVYIMDLQIEDTKTDIGMKAQILLLLIGKYLNSRNLSLSKISDIASGITRHELDEISALEDAAELLERAGMNNNFFDNVKNILVDRHILLEKTTSQSYVLSAIGQAFFTELKNLYKHQ